LIEKKEENKKKRKGEIEKEREWSVFTLQRKEDEKK